MNRGARQPDVVRFWMKFEPGLSDDECWLWLGSKTPAGYGLYYDEPAHRAAYRIDVGPIGAGLELDHLCRVRACCNPAHLEPVTRAENNRRANAVSANKSCCVRGHELVGANIYIDPRGWRQCRQCRRDSDARFKTARRARLCLWPDPEREDQMSDRLSENSDRDRVSCWNTRTRSERA